jgi:hypothetical protein
MAKLSIEDTQKTAIIDPVDTTLHNALNEGVDAPSYPLVLAATQGYAGLAGGFQAVVKNMFRVVVAALVSTLNIRGPLPTIITLGTKFTGTVALAKLTPGGANGSLTVDSGVITAYTAPT